MISKGQPGQATARSFRLKTYILNMRSETPLEESNFSPSDPSLSLILPADNPRLKGLRLGVEGGSPSAVDDEDSPGPVMETTGMGELRLAIGSAAWSSMFAAFGSGRGGEEVRKLSVGAGVRCRW